jgi:hypothetical protein
MAGEKNTGGTPTPLRDGGAETYKLRNEPPSHVLVREWVVRVSAEDVRGRVCASQKRSYNRQEPTSQVATSAEVAGTQVRIKYAILPNEPTVGCMNMRIDVFGRQLVVQRRKANFRWVRFGKRTHREGVSEGRRGHFQGKVCPFGGAAGFTLTLESPAVMRELPSAAECDRDET